MFSRFNRQYFDLWRAMTLKEFAARYKRASFGFLWIFINPIAQMLIIGTVFSHYVRMPNYYLFLITGLLPWQFFTSSLQTATYGFVNERSLLQKTVFPREIIPLAIIGANFLDLSVALLLTITAVFLITPPSIINLLLIVPALFWLLIFLTGLSLLTASLNVRYRDVAFFVQSLTLLWFYATPILYSLSMMPVFLQKLMYLNPLATPFVLIQTALLNQPPPSTALILANACLSVLILLLGIWTFKQEQRYFVDWL